MRKLFGFAAVALVATVFAGCGDKAGGIVGTWTIDMGGLREGMRPKLEEEFKKQKAQLDTLPADQKAMAEKMMPSLDKMLDQAFEQFGKMSMEVTFESGGTATFNMEQGTTKESGKGTWKQEGDKILVTTTEKNGKPATDAEKKDSPPLTFKDGKLTMEGPGMVIPFKRK